jgi:GNAT superfamily N-acetyltransferase
MITIDRFQLNDQNKVKNFVLNIQNNEFLLGFSEMDQPDLIDIAHFYRDGGFWTAKSQNEIVGTIGLQKIDAYNAVLRKMFVKKELRGRELSIAQRLFDILFEDAKMKGFQTIWLDTPAVATASHQFYERNGFVQSDKQNLPNGYVFPDKNSKIYKLTVK